MDKKAECPGKDHPGAGMGRPNPMTNTMPKKCGRDWLADLPLALARLQPFLQPQVQWASDEPHGGTTADGSLPPRESSRTRTIHADHLCWLLTLNRPLTRNGHGGMERKNQHNQRADPHTSHTRRPALATVTEGRKRAARPLFGNFILHHRNHIGF